jgi:predicted dehydrogenase
MSTGRRGSPSRSGRAAKLVDTARRLGRVFQTGTQQRSQGQFRRAVEMARNGYLGQLTERAGQRAQRPRNTSRKLSIVKPTPVPEDIDYDLWLGPAPYTPYDEKKCTYYWYFMSDTCAGWIQSWGIHHIDIAHWGCPEFGRGRVTVEGEAQFPTDGLADVSYAWRVKYTSDTGLTIDYKNDETPGFEHGVRFIGDEGWVHVTRGGMDANPKSLLNLVLKPDDIHEHVSNNHVIDDFFLSMRTRRDPSRRSRRATRPTRSPSSPTSPPAWAAS